MAQVSQNKESPLFQHILTHQDLLDPYVHTISFLVTVPDIASRNAVLETVNNKLFAQLDVYPHLLAAVSTILSSILSAIQSGVVDIEEEGNGIARVVLVEAYKRFRTDESTKQAMWTLISGYLPSNLDPLEHLLMFDADWSACKEKKQLSKVMQRLLVLLSPGHKKPPTVMHIAQDLSLKAQRRAFEGDMLASLTDEENMLAGLW
jgi:hypothetical protein